VTKLFSSTQAFMLPTFRAVFDDHYDYVWNSLRRLGVAASDLDDVVDEVFMRVHGKLDTYDPSRPIRPWLFAFAFRAASDYRRLARHRVFAASDEDNRDPGPTPEEAAMQNDTGRLVQKALDALSLSTRAVLVMYEIDGRDMKEIAEALEIPLNTAYSRLRLARGTFEAKVRELRGEEAAPDERS
jgi:RNA polymerase sigma-70 factor, ECF subfamily